MLKQISIFTENKKGAMRSITETFLEEGINILGSVTNDSAEYGIARFLVSDPEKAFAALGKKGFLCHLTKVIGVELEDSTGTLNQLLISLEDSNINVDYIYLSYNRQTVRPIIIIHCGEIEEVEACLETKGYSIL